MVEVAAVVLLVEHCQLLIIGVYLQYHLELQLLEVAAHFIHQYLQTM